MFNLGFRKVSKCPYCQKIYRKEAPFICIKCGHRICKNNYTVAKPTIFGWKQAFNRNALNVELHFVKDEDFPLEVGEYLALKNKTWGTEWTIIRNSSVNERTYQWKDVLCWCALPVASSIENIE